MGDLMRQYWIPACLSSELEPGAQPMRLLLQGEQLIAFRDRRGRVGIMDHRCPHRRASLFLGRSEGDGIRNLAPGVDHPEVFRNARSGAFLAPESQGWYEAYLEHLGTIVGPRQPARAAE